MIQVHITTALLIYLSCVLAFLIFIWAKGCLKKRHKKMTPPLHVLTVCEYCQYAYLATAVYAISRCPQCRSYNRIH